MLEVGMRDVEGARGDGRYGFVVLLIDKPVVCRSSCCSNSLNAIFPLFQQNGKEWEKYQKAQRSSTSRRNQVNHATQFSHG